MTFGAVFCKTVGRMNGNIIFGVRHTIDHFVVAFILTLWILLMVRVNWQFRLPATASIAICVRQ